MGFFTLGAGGSLRPYIERASPYTRWLVHEVATHKAISIFLVIALEEIGVPLPLPGDVFIAYAGHLVARGRIDAVTAFLSIVTGSMAGASLLYYVARQYGQPFVRRYGPYMHIKQNRLDMVERWFVRWGPLVIVLGRQIPGLRMVISVFAGIFGVPYRTFLASVTLAAAIWAGMFLYIGYRLDRHLGPYMTITPAHLLPSTIFISATIVYGIYLKRRAVREDRRRAAVSEAKSEAKPQLAESKARW
jgi:membrane protein DedA with SNARE-associated domain